MTDNTTLNAGSGGDVIRDLARTTGPSSGTKTQVVQLDFGGANTNAESLVSATNGLPVYQAAALPAGTNVIGSVLGRTSKVSVNPTVTASAYTAGWIVGGVMTFANVFDAQNSGTLQSVRVRCKTVQTANLKLYLLTAPTTGGTVADHGAPAIASADIANLIGPFVLSGYDSGLGTETTWELDGIGAAIVGASANLYGILVQTGTLTPTSTSDITVELTTLKD